jgi:mono/diheme cytochrome c family protein
MRKLLRRLLQVLAGLLVLAVLLIAAGWIASEIRVDKRYTDVPATAPRLKGDAAAGKHWASILACSACHARDLGGQVLDDNALAGRLVAPNLTQKRKLYSDAELARMIRYGIKHDGHGAWVMPSDGFYHLDDQTVADVIAYIRSVPEVKRDLPETTNGPLTRLGLLIGKFDLVTNSIDRHAPRMGDAPRPTAAQQGRYLATVVCAECHGVDQHGKPDEGLPDLAIAKIYTPAEFTDLMRGRWAKGHRDAPMVHVARARFTDFTDEEIAQIKAWLDVRPVVASVSSNAH